MAAGMSACQSGGFLIQHYTLGLARLRAAVNRHYVPWQPPVPMKGYAEQGASRFPISLPRARLTKEREQK